MESHEDDLTGAPEGASHDADTLEGGAADAASLIESVVVRDRPRDPATQAEIAAIRERAMLAAKVAADAKGEDVKLLDMQDVVTYTDFLVLSTGKNVRLTKHIAEDVAFKLKQEFKIMPAGVEGVGGGEWILMDYMDFIVHVFTPEARDFYRLDVLWKSAPAEVIE
jgi:ribosome-associated protein